MCPGREETSLLESFDTKPWDPLTLATQGDKGSAVVIPIKGRAFNKKKSCRSHSHGYGNINNSKMVLVGVKASILIFFSYLFYKHFLPLEAGVFY